MERQSLIKGLTPVQMQYLIDNTADRFRPILWPNFFEWKNKPSISFETIIGTASNAAAASVVSYDSAAPLRTRKNVRKLTGEIPSIRQKFQMTEKDLQDYISMSNGASADAQAVIDTVYDDLRMCGEAPHKRLDIFALEALSTGYIVLNTTKNPDGMVTEDSIDFGMPAANREQVTVVWSAADKATVKPITDIMAVASAAADIGVVLDRMMMTRATFNLMKLADETVSYVTGYAIGSGTAKINMTLTSINDFLIAEGLPRIVLIEASIGVEKDGVVTSFNPWDTDNVTFVPAGPMGQMMNAPIIERLYPVEQVMYAEYNNVLIKKWSETDPVKEYTACELNAFPSWNNIDKCFILDTEDAA